MSSLGTGALRVVVVALFLLNRGDDLLHELVGGCGCQPVEPLVGDCGRTMRGAGGVRLRPRQLRRPAMRRQTHPVCPGNGSGLRRRGGGRPPLIVLRFNEAAGIPRGRRERRRAGRGDARGHFNEAAGIPRGRPRTRYPARSRHRHFNEAAGIPRGRRPGRSRSRIRRSHFNEAAGIPRGRPVGLGRHQPSSPPTSMRPRVFPAEDTWGAVARTGAALTSMRPRVFPAEDFAMDMEASMLALLQ